MDKVERVAEAIRKEIGTRHQGLPKGGWDGLMKKTARAAILAMDGVVSEEAIIDHDELGRILSRAYSAFR